MIRKESLEDTLLLAVKANQLEVSKRCLECGAKGVLADIDGNRAVHIAVSNIASDDKERKILRLLLDHGVDTSVENNAGHTPANMAACNGDWDTVIIIANARPVGSNKRDYGHAVLYGAKNNRLDVIQALSKTGVSLGVHTLNEGRHMRTLEIVVFILRRVMKIQSCLNFSFNFI